MKVRWVRKGNKWKRKLSMEVDDWLVLILVCLVFTVAIVQFILWS